MTEERPDRSGARTGRTAGGAAGRKAGLEREKKVLTARRPRCPAALGSWREPCRPVAATVGSADRTWRWGSTGCRQFCRRIHARTAFESTLSSSASSRTVSDEAPISAPYRSANRPQTGPSRRQVRSSGIRHSRFDSLRSSTIGASRPEAAKIKTPLTSPKQNPRHVEARRGFLG